MANLDEGGRGTRNLSSPFISAKSYTKTNSA